MSASITAISDQFSNDFHQSDQTSSPVEGVLTSSDISTVHSADPSTIDEPIKDTIFRDVKAIGNKFCLVFVPKSSAVLLKEWDLWGPLFLCTILALLLEGHGAISNGDSIISQDVRPHFAQVFIVYWTGAAVVTLNAQLLSQSDSDSKLKAPGFLQSVCVLGYCVLPLLVALILSQLAALVIPSIASLPIFIVRILCTSAGLAWSVYSASVAFLPAQTKIVAMPSEQHPQEAATEPPLLFANRRWLVAYPICLFYFVLAWLVLSGSA